jgi:hypothetical protein
MGSVNTRPLRNSLTAPLPPDAGRQRRHRHPMHSLAQLRAAASPRVMRGRARENGMSPWKWDAGGETRERVVRCGEGGRADGAHQPIALSPPVAVAVPLSPALIPLERKAEIAGCPPPGVVLSRVQLPHPHSMFFSLARERAMQLEEAAERCISEGTRRSKGGCGV